MPAVTWETRRSELHTYFDRTAVEAWARLTSEAPVSGIRATVRAGRERMRATLLSWLPQNLRGARLLDAGCGTGALAVEAARRGADVLAIDLSPTLVALAKERAPRDLGAGRVTFVTGDMADPALGRFDHAVAMDSMIHYAARDAARAMAALAGRCSASALVTFAPRTLPLTAMHLAGKLFPRADRSPAIVPVREAHLRRLLELELRAAAGRLGRTARVDAGFYISQALEFLPSRRPAP